MSAVNVLDIKRAVSCEVALSKRVGWGMLNLILTSLIYNNNFQFRKFMHA